MKNEFRELFSGLGWGKIKIEGLFQRTGQQFGASSFRGGTTRAGDAIRGWVDGPFGWNPGRVWIASGGKLFNPGEVPSIFRRSQGLVGQASAGGRFQGLKPAPEVNKAPSKKEGVLLQEVRIQELN